MNDAQAGALLHMQVCEYQNIAEQHDGQQSRRERATPAPERNPALAPEAGDRPTWTECWIVSAMTAQPDATRPNTINGKTDADPP
jgi:hypothetical protein